MSLTINKAKVINPEVRDCICGGKPEHSSYPTYCTGTSGAAYVKCPQCGLGMTEESHNIGYGESLESIYYTVVDRWNSVMSKKN